MIGTASTAITGLLLFVLAQANPAPGGEDLWRLGVIAVAMVFGAALTYRYTTLPERVRAERAEKRADAAEAERVEAYKITLPLVASSNDLAQRVLTAMSGVEALVSPKRPAQ